ncbi:MAG: hypothetical protein AB9833_11260 [Bacteroidales bacterium]
MCERKIKRKTRLRNRLLLFRRNKHKRLLNRLNRQEEFPGRISEKLLNDSVCQFTNGKGVLQMNIREMENLIVLLHEECDTINKDQRENIFLERIEGNESVDSQNSKKNNY